LVDYATRTRIIPPQSCRIEDEDVKTFGDEKLIEKVRAMNEEIIEEVFVESTTREEEKEDGLSKMVLFIR
jgi:hypothetical protein